MITLALYALLAFAVFLSALPAWGWAWSLTAGVFWGPLFVVGLLLRMIDYAMHMLRVLRYGPEALHHRRELK